MRFTSLRGCSESTIYFIFIKVHYPSLSCYYFPLRSLGQVKNNMPHWSPRVPWCPAAGAKCTFASAGLPPAPWGPKAHGPQGPWAPRPMGPKAHGPQSPWAPKPMGPKAHGPHGGAQGPPGTQFISFFKIFNENNVIIHDF